MCHASEIFLWSEIWWSMGTIAHSTHSEVLQSEVLRLMVKCSYIAASQTSVTISKLECCPCSFWVGLCQAHPKINSQVIFFPLGIAPTLLVTDESNQHTLHWNSFLWESCRGILQRSASCRASRISEHFVLFSGSCFILLFVAMKMGESKPHLHSSCRRVKWSHLCPFILAVTVMILTLRNLPSLEAWMGS